MAMTVDVARREAAVARAGAEAAGQAAREQAREAAATGNREAVVPLLMPAAKAGKLLGISGKDVRSLIDAGVLRAVRFPTRAGNVGHFKVVRADVEALCEGRMPNRRAG